MIHRDVNLTLPRFKTQFNMEMTPVLKQVYSYAENSPCPKMSFIFFLNFRWAFATYLIVMQICRE